MTDPTDDFAKLSPSDQAKSLISDGLNLLGDFKALLTPRPLEEWHEGIGPCLWWAFPITEAPYVGDPRDLGHEILSVIITGCGADSKQIGESRSFVGGWPGYHTHWTPLPIPPPRVWPKVAEPPKDDANAG